MNLIFLGVPGAGKGTQSEIICSKLNIPVISTGNIVRDAVKSETDFGFKAKSYIDSGHLVPDDVIIGIVRDRLNFDDCKDGLILDGFPRTVAQAKALDEMINIDLVINIDVDKDYIIQRLKGRVVCKECSLSYNINSRKPKIDGICDKCKGQLIKRKDDDEQVVLQRLNVYDEETKPLIRYYKDSNLLLNIDGKKSLEENTEVILKFLGVSK